LKVFRSDCINIEQLIDGVEPEDFNSQLRMEVFQFSGFLDFINVNNSNLFPEVHLLVFGNNLFNVPLNKEVLINERHIANHLPHINWRGQSNQSSDRFTVVVLTQISHEVVSSKTSADHVNWGVGIVVLNAVECGFELAVLAGSEWHRACHLVVDSSAVEADGLVTVIGCFGHQGLDVVHF
jgi:hypothetical protein